MQDKLEIQRETMDERDDVIRRIVEHSKRIWFTSAALTLLSALLGIAASAASLSPWVSSIRIRWSYVWFLGGILAFQTLFIFMVWIVRKRNRRIIKVKEDLIKIYVSAINRSSLNPNLKKSES